MLQSVFIKGCHRKRGRRGVRPGLLEGHDSGDGMCTYVDGTGDSKGTVTL
jgi:hypothetical protein